MPTDGFIYGLDEFYFGGQLLGYISDAGASWGGNSPSNTQVRAAQARNAVVKTILNQPGNNTLEFELIELRVANIVTVMGGTATAGVYNAPRDISSLEDRAFIKCASGHKIDMPKTLLTTNLSGGVNLSGLMSIKCSLELELSDDDAKGPFQIYEPDVVVPNDPSVAQG